MGSELAAAHNTLYSIEEEETHIKATFKERKASVEQTIGKLSRELGSGFTMQNIECRWMYDFPNVGEVAYQRIDTSEIVKTRAMTAQERQQELPLEPVAVNPQKPEETQAAVLLHFSGKDQDPDKFPVGQVVDAEWVDPQVDAPADVVGEPYGEPLETVITNPDDCLPGTYPEDPQPEPARQTLLTMGDAKKGRKKKAPEPVVTTDDDIPF